LEIDSAHALDRLAIVDPHDSSAIMDLQNEIARLRWFAETIDILIRQGFELDSQEEIEE